MNIGVVGAARYFMSAGANTGSEAALRGISIDQIVMPLLEFEAAGRLLIGCMDNRLLARSAAIGFCDIEVYQVLARADPAGHVVSDMLDADGMP
jgi:hypothetical protein